VLTPAGALNAVYSSQVLIGENITTVWTPRLVLRRLQDQDRALVRAMDANIDIMGADGVRSADESDEFVSGQIDHWDRHGFGIWIAFDRASSACVGRCGLRHVEVEGQEVVQVGYGLFPAFWGQGLATEVAMASARVAFDVLGIPRVVAVALPANLASRRVLEKAGFTHIGETVYDDVLHVVYECRGMAGPANPSGLDERRSR
jgi:RimJ/RimL family protein N-acetyltransferase